MKKLKQQRRAVGLSQHALGHLARVSRARIAYAETGRTKLTEDELERIKGALALRAREVAEMVAA